MAAHDFQPDGSRMICQKCGLIEHRGNGVTACEGPRVVEIGGHKIRFGPSPAETQDAAAGQEIAERRVMTAGGG